MTKFWKNFDRDESLPDLFELMRAHNNIYIGKRVVSTDGIVSGSHMLQLKTLDQRNHFTYGIAIAVRRSYYFTHDTFCGHFKVDFDNRRIYDHNGSNVSLQHLFSYFFDKVN